MIRVLVVDDDDNFIKDINDYYKNDKDILIMASVSDGNEAIKYISNDIDIIILDLIMPNKDGYGLLRYIRENNFKQQVIVISSTNLPRMLSVIGVKIDYFSLKPINFDDLKSVIIALYEKNYVDESKKVYYELTKLLSNLGIPSNINGFHYIRAAILKLYESEELPPISELYRVVAKRYKTSGDNVERCIRHAIDVSWIRGDLDLIDEYFGSSIDLNKAKPTNSEYLYTIADRIKIDYSK